jgi:hypothetical protein
MGNVIRLFARRSDELAPSEPETCFSTASTSILASSAQLAHAASDLSKQFDAIENAIDTIHDAETRARLKQSTKLSRETLSKAMLKLSQEISKSCQLPRCVSPVLAHLRHAAEVQERPVIGVDRKWPAGGQKGA